MFTTFKTGNYIPLTWISHALVYHFGGLKPMAHHAFNIILHGINTGLLFVLLLNILNIAKSRSSFLNYTTNREIVLASFFAAIIWGIHPLRVESVSWVSERKDLGSALFFFACLISYLRYAKNGSKAAYVFSLVFFTASLLFKPMAVTAPLIMLLFDQWPLMRISRLKESAAYVAEKIPFFLIAGAAGVLAIMAQSQAGAVAPADQLSAVHRIVNAAYAVFFYIFKTILPINISPFYPLLGLQDLTESPAHMFTIIGCVILFSGTLIMRARKPLLVTMLFYMITLLPVIGILQVGSQAAADRYTYIPTISIICAVVVAFLMWSKRSATNGASQAKIIKYIALIGIMAIFSIVTVRQQSVWKDSLSLWTRAYRLYPDVSSLINTNAGVAYNDKGDYEKGIPLLQTALRLSPDNHGALTGLGFAYYEIGQNEKALPLIEKAIKVYPAIGGEAFNNLGNVYCAFGRFEDAINAYNKALARSPGATQVYGNLGNAYCGLGKFEDAVNVYKKALEANNEDHYTYNNLGNAYESLGRKSEAIEAYKEAIKIKPDFVEALYNLGSSYEQQGQVREAIGMYQMAIKANPKYIRSQKAFIRLLRSAGKENEAIEAEKQAAGYGIR